MAFGEEVNEVFFLVPEYGHLNCYTRLSNTLDTSLNSITLETQVESNLLITFKGKPQLVNKTAGRGGTARTKNGLNALLNPQANMKKPSAPSY